MLLGLSFAIAYIVWQARRRKARQEEVTPGGHDEEEGLIKMNGDMEVEVGDENDGDVKENGNMAVIIKQKHRQGRRPPKILASVETLDYEEDEGNEYSKTPVMWPPSRKATPDMWTLCFALSDIFDCIYPL